MSRTTSILVVTFAVTALLVACDRSENPDKTANPDTAALGPPPSPPPPTPSIGPSPDSIDSLAAPGDSAPR